MMDDVTLLRRYAENRSEGDSAELVRRHGRHPHFHEPASEAVTLFARLPGKLRQEFASPERLIAVLAAKDVPLGSAVLLNQDPTPTETKLSVQVFDAEGKHKFALLSVRPDDAGWRFVVPVNAVKRYAAWLQAPPSITLPTVTIGGNP